MARPKTARAIEANVGIRQAFAKRLTRLSSDFMKTIANEIFLHMANQGVLAKDWSLSKPTLENDKRRLREIRRAVLRAWKRDPEAFKADIEGYVQKNIGKWTVEVNTASEKLATWLAKNIASDVTTTQRKAYEVAGISPDVFKQKWSIPNVRQHISPTAAKRIPDIVKDATELITKMTVRDVTRLQDVIVNGLTQGQSVDRVRRTLAAFQGFDKDRASRVAIDQTNKITQGILRANDEDLGVTEGIWIHVPGQYTSRSTHKAMHGKRFKISEGLYDSDVGKYVVPGQCPFCRCIYRPVLPKDMK